MVWKSGGVHYLSDNISVHNPARNNNSYIIYNDNGKRFRSVSLIGSVLCTEFSKNKGG